MWSDHEEERFQLRNRRVRILRALFCGFVLLAAGALILRDAASVALFIAALVALGATALLGARWQLNGNTAATRRQRLERRAERQDLGARRERAIREGTWAPPGRPS
jgi:uncharacterized membrane protein